MSTDRMHDGPPATKRDVPMLLTAIHYMIWTAVAVVASSIVDAYSVSFHAERVLTVFAAGMAAVIYFSEETMSRGKRPGMVEWVAVMLLGTGCMVLFMKIPETAIMQQFLDAFQTRLTF